MPVESPSVLRGHGVREDRSVAEQLQPERNTNEHERYRRTTPPVMMAARNGHCAG